MGMNSDLAGIEFEESPGVGHMTHAQASMDESSILSIPNLDDSMLETSTNTNSYSNSIGHTNTNTSTVDTPDTVFYSPSKTPQPNRSGTGVLNDSPIHSFSPSDADVEVDTVEEEPLTRAEVVTKHITRAALDAEALPKATGCTTRDVVNANMLGELSKVLTRRSSSGGDLEVVVAAELDTDTTHTLRESSTTPTPISNPVEEPVEPTTEVVVDVEVELDVAATPMKETTDTPTSPALNETVSSMSTPTMNDSVLNSSVSETPNTAKLTARYVHNTLYITLYI